MAYKALYRKWRPVIFDDVIGQAHITNTLKNEICENKISHAYLFTGTRGTGKTSTAKILSRAVNCLNPQNGNPCNECEVCKSILNDTVLDIIEIDAASNTGVDNIRTVIEQVQYAPTVGKYKVYIIDEVHMLTGGAFNALLKTLEEPPSHVIFILATTETHKVPATILSRCQRFDFKTISLDDISSRISYILDKENIKVEKQAIDYVSYLGQGSMRDALSILEQCFSFAGDVLTYDKAVEILGGIDDKILYDIADDVSKNDVKSVVERFEKIVSDGKNLDNFVPMLIDVFRQLIVSKVSDGNIKVCYDDTKNEMAKSIASHFTKERLICCLDILTELANLLKYNSMQHTMIEIALIRMTNPVSQDDYNSLVSRICALENKIEGNVVSFEAEKKFSEIKHNEKVVDALKESVKLEVKKENEKVENSNSQKSTNSTDGWKKVIANVFSNGGLQLYSAIYSANAFVNGNVVTILCNDLDKNQTLISYRNEILKYVKEVFGDDAEISFEETKSTSESSSKNLFENLNGLSDKFPENFDIK